MNVGKRMELRDLEYFVVVAEKRTLARAAESLNLSQPALSKGLKRLEEGLQAKLFRRTAGGMELTAEGSLLLARARDLRQYLLNVAREVSDVSRGHSGHLNIGVGQHSTDDLFFASITELLRAEPKITTNVTVTDQDELIPALLNGKVDIVYNLVHFMPPADLTYLPIRKDECVVCCAKDHPLTQRKALKLTDVAQERWALGEPSLPTMQTLYQVFRDNGFDTPKAALVSRSVPLRLRAVANSDLLMYGAKALIQTTGQLAILPIKELRWVRSVGVFHRQEPYLTPTVRCFMRILKKMATRAEIDGEPFLPNVPTA